MSTADAYPMPRVDDMTDKVGRAKYINTLRPVSTPDKAVRLILITIN